jgi:hypothetical protein
MRSLLRVLLIVIGLGLIMVGLLAPESVQEVIAAWVTLP